MMRGPFAMMAAVLVAAGMQVPAHAQPPLSIRNSFRVGTAGVLCSAQIASADKRLSGLFDRAYRLTCRDAAGAVGSVLAVRRDIPLDDRALACDAVETAQVKGLGAVQSRLCHDRATGLDYRRYGMVRGATHYLAEGLAGYDPVLRLALASIVNDRIEPGEVVVASTDIGDPAAFARVQAGSLDTDNARAEAYARNNDGRFAEAAEFFDVLAGRQDEGAQRAELIANAGLQQSNLGNFSAAYALFLRAEKQTARSDGLMQRLLRNYRAINLLNQHFADATLTVLDAPMAAVQLDYDVDNARKGVVSEPLADQINRENAGLRRLGGVESGLSPAERAATLDAQAIELRGVALIQAGRLDEADAALEKSDRAILAIRQGRLNSARWLRAQIGMERAGIAEAKGDANRAGALYRAAVDVLQTGYPDTPALLAAKARLAGFLARSGDGAGARALFRTIVDQSEHISDSATALRDLLSPYFALLVDKPDAAAPADLFHAAQSLQRPGVASTQAVLARELSEGDDEAAALFRLSVARTREIGRAESEIARLSALPQPTASEQDVLARLRQTLETLRTEQTALTARLSRFPRYKVLAPTSVSLAELQGKLGEGEAYYKLAIIGDAAYAIFTDAHDAAIYRVDQDATALEAAVAQLRGSIVRIENGQVTTYPFDVTLARALYVSLFGPVADRMAKVSHLIFEPDGPLLQLPPSLLVTDDAGVKAYQARLAKPKADPFDLRGIAWLGRNRRSTIAVSPRAFIDIRTVAPSKARQAYLGLGENAVPAAFPTGKGQDPCDWPLSTWQAPINPAELNLARSLMGPSRSAVMTQAAFTDEALDASTKLADYRVLHFATHGLVTAPRPQCPARPALVTSFGPDAASDGLLSFKEIFDLKLDADLVILSACDTAGMATAAASREAGVRTGGNYALDGLVRAFVGAGARSVIASHWPVPDDYDATNRLIGGLFGGKPGESIGARLDRAQMTLMDKAETSHPFYWAAFVILGDGAKPMPR